MAWRPWGGGAPPPDPLPPVLPPEPARDSPAYLNRVFSESRGVLDSDLAGFERLESKPARGFAVYRKPVEKGKGVSRRCR